MDRLDVGDIDLFLGLGESFAFVVGGAVGERFCESLSDAGAEFAGGLFGEGDGDDFAEFGLALADGLDDALDHHAGFAGACAGFEEERSVELVDDPVADGLVGGGPGGAHRLLRWATRVSKSAVTLGWRRCLCR